MAYQIFSIVDDFSMEILCEIQIKIMLFWKGSKLRNNTFFCIQLFVLGRIQVRFMFLYVNCHIEGVPITYMHFFRNIISDFMLLRKCMQRIGYTFNVTINIKNINLTCILPNTKSCMQKTYYFWDYNLFKTALFLFEFHKGFPLKNHP